MILLSDKLTIPLGRTWVGYEFITIQRYKRKPRFKITSTIKYWSGKFRTLGIKYAKTAEEIIDIINNEMLIPIFKLPREAEEKIRNFCKGCEQ